MNPTKFDRDAVWIGRFWTMLARGACVGLTVLLVAACGALSTISERPVAAVKRTTEDSTTDLEELHAFAKLYGYVRYFHPSDEAAAADWETIAIEGARRIVQGSTRAELLAGLREIFQPLAPTLLVFPIEAPPPPAEPPWSSGGLATRGVRVRVQHVCVSIRPDPSTATVVGTGARLRHADRLDTGRASPRQAGAAARLGSRRRFTPQ